MQGQKEPLQPCEETEGRGERGEGGEGRWGERGSEGKRGDDRSRQERGGTERDTHGEMERGVVITTRGRLTLLAMV